MQLFTLHTTEALEAHQNHEKRGHFQKRDGVGVSLSSIFHNKKLMST